MSDLEQHPTTGHKKELSFEGTDTRQVLINGVHTEVDQKAYNMYRNAGADIQEIDHSGQHGEAPTREFDKTPLHKAVDEGLLNPDRIPTGPTLPTPLESPARKKERRRLTKGQKMIVGAVLASTTIGVGTSAYMANRMTNTADEMLNGGDKAASASPFPNNEQEGGVLLGNIHLADETYSQLENTDNNVDASWGTPDGKSSIYLSKLLGPADHTPDEIASSALNLYAAAVSANLEYSPQLMPYLTVDPGMVSYTTRVNTQFRSAESSTEAEDQLVFFDTAADPAVFTEVQGPESPVLELESGTLYVARVNASETDDVKWQHFDDSIVEDAKPIHNLSIAYQPSPDGQASTIKTISGNDFYQIIEAVKDTA